MIRFPQPQDQKGRLRTFARGHRSSAGAAGLALVALTCGTLFVTTPHRAALMAGSSALAAEAASTPITELPSFASLVDRVKPAVVSVYVESQQSPIASFKEQLPGQNLPQGSPFEFFFRQFGKPGQGWQEFTPRTQLVRAQGSGFFISPDGYILTNNHVVDHAKRVEIRTTDGKSYRAKVVGTDAKTDLAVLKVKASARFPYVTFAETAPRVGDWVLAMGNPYGLGGTVTAGIVSASGRDIGAGPYDDYLQIDAPVNKGNSGGPTFNLKGEVIGINTAIYSPSGGSVGIAFDIPAQTAKTVAQQLENKGVVTRGWIGVTVQPISGDIAESLGLKQAKGALVDNVQSGGPAAKAGLKSGDVILSLDGTEIRDARDLARKVAALTPGSTVKIQSMRNGTDRTLELTLGTLPSDASKLAQADQEHPGLGLTLAPADELSGTGSSGVVVLNVDPGSAADERGIQSGDVILDVAGKPVATPSQVRSAITEAKSHGKAAALLHLKTANGNRYVALPVG
jgi:serine protease Do